PRHAPLRVLLLFLSSLLRPLPFLPPSPTRRSSDLGQAVAGATFPVPIWHLYMAAAEWRKPARQFLEPTHEISYTPLQKHYYGYTYNPTPTYTAPATTTTTTTPAAPDAPTHPMTSPAEQTPHPQE